VDQMGFKQLVVVVCLSPFYVLWEVTVTIFKLGRRTARRYPLLRRTTVRNVAATPRAPSPRPNTSSTIERLRLLDRPAAVSIQPEMLELVARPTIVDPLPEVLPPPPVILYREVSPYRSWYNTLARGPSDS